MLKTEVVLDYSGINMLMTAGGGVVQTPIYLQLHNTNSQLSGNSKEMARAHQDSKPTNILETNSVQ